MISHDTERRAPVLTRHEIQADTRALRKVLSEVEQGLDGIAGSTRRTMLLLVGALADQWSRPFPPKEQSMTLEIDRFSDRLRLEAFSNEELPEGFWLGVGTSAAPGLADRWGVDRRHHRGVWFEVATSQPTGFGPRRVSPE